MEENNIEVTKDSQDQLWVELLQNKEAGILLTQDIEKVILAIKQEGFQISKIQKHA